MSSISTIYIMGVSGCGKSTIGQKLAENLHWQFKDGDSLHPDSNIQKMRSGEPLNDTDRLPWLQSINEFARAHLHCVIACSSLKKSYRRVLSEHLGGRVKFFLLDFKREILEKRVASRPGHFMPSSLLSSQLATLEMPGADEPEVVVIDAGDDGVEKIVKRIVEKLQ